MFKEFRSFTASNADKFKLSRNLDLKLDLLKQKVDTYGISFLGIDPLTRDRFQALETFALAVAFLYKPVSLLDKLKTPEQQILIPNQGILIAPHIPRGSRSYNSFHILGYHGIFTNGTDYWGKFKNEELGKAVLNAWDNFTWDS